MLATSSCYVVFFNRYCVCRVSHRVAVCKHKIICFCFATAHSSSILRRPTTRSWCCGAWSFANIFATHDACFLREFLQNMETYMCTTHGRFGLSFVSNRSVNAVDKQTCSCRRLLWKRGATMPPQQIHCINCTLRQSHVTSLSRSGPSSHARAASISFSA